MDAAVPVAQLGHAAPVIAVALIGVFLLVRFVRSLGDPFALARGGHAHRLRALLEQDASLAKAKDANGETLLHHAAKHGELAVMKLLLAAGADPNAKTPVGATPLHVARAFGDERAAKLLLDAGAADDPASSISDDDPEMKRAASLARSKASLLRELYADHAATTQVKVDGEWRDVGDLERDVERMTDWKVTLADGTVRGGFGSAVVFARAKKDLGALPPALADEQKRYVDHVTE